MARLLAAAPSRSESGIAGQRPAIPAHPDGIHAAAANELLTAAGFLLVPGAPFAPGPAYLMIALRPKPTYAHFDPERIEYWSLNDGRSESTSLDWSMADASPEFAWGTIKIVDRVAAHNEFTSFGGQLTVARDGNRRAALFRSDAPILSLGGRSGRGDVFAVQVAAFFGRLRAAAGDPEKRATIDNADPVAMYAAFLVRTLATFRARSVAGASAPRVASVLQSEVRRLQRDQPAAVQDGLEIESTL